MERCIDRRNGKIYQVNEVDDFLIDIGDEWVHEKYLIFLTDEEVDAMLLAKYKMYIIDE